MKTCYIDRKFRLGCDVTVQKVALTIEQVREYNPPPNPAKMSDSRAANYVAEHGDESWEVDALPPDVLQSLLREVVESVLDRPKMDGVLEREEEDKTRLRTALESLTSE